MQITNPFLAVIMPTRELVDQVSGLPFVDYVEEDPRRYPTGIIGRKAHVDEVDEVAEIVKGALSPQTIPYGINLTQAFSLSDSNAANRKLCIIDSGYDFNHEDLSNSKTKVTGSPAGWDTDKCYHGTHVAGTISALNNNVGVMGVMSRGAVNLHIVKVFADTCAWNYASGLIAAAQNCQSASSNTISMSLGGATSSATEQTGFQNLYNAGLLSIAAAGNAGTSAFSYPASYASVVSIAAVDSTSTVASFSQFNNQVEWAAPGVAVLSTVGMGGGDLASTYIGGNPGSYIASIAFSGDSPQYESPKGDTGYVNLCNCGTGTASCTTCSRAVCLIQRGTNSFAEKVINCQNGGGVAAIIYNNVAGSFTGTLGSTATKIPSVGLSLADGNTALAQVGKLSRVVVATDNYMYYDGTSMATPHASAVATLVWSYFPTCTNAKIRAAISNSTTPLGSPQPRNNYYGYGLIQAVKAYNYLNTNKC